jgi:hypothetical protein
VLANCSLNQLSLEQPTVRPARGVRHVYMVWAPPGSRSDITKHQQRCGESVDGAATTAVARKGTRACMSAWEGCYGSH